MQQREKVLAAIVGGLLFLLLAVWGISWVSSSYAQRRQTRNAKQAQAARMEELRTQRNTMNQHLDRLYERSLPPDVGSAQTRYSTWLTGLAKDPDVQLRGHSVRTLDASSEPNFHRLKFQLNGYASLKQLMKLLHEFYSADHLHKITLLRATPIPKTKELDVSISIEALSLKAAGNNVFPGVKKALVDDLKVDAKKVTAEATLAGDLGVMSISNTASALAKVFGVELAPAELVAPGAKEFPKEYTVQAICDSVESKVFARKCSPRLEHGDWEAYLDKVVRRNFFDYNRSPQFSSQRFTATIGRRFRESLRASDPDGNTLKYEIVESTTLPPGMTLQGRTLSWSPDEKLKPGSYRFRVRVTDDGDPPIDVEETVTVSLVPPVTPTRPAEFDHAQFAFLEGLVQVNGRPEAWITVRTLAKKEDRELTLHAGDERKIGKLQFKVMDIDLDERTMWVVFSDLEGSAPVRLGQTLFAALESAKRVSKTETSQVVK